MAVTQRYIIRSAGSLINLSMIIPEMKLSTVQISVDKNPSILVINMCFFVGTSTGDLNTVPMYSSNTFKQTKGILQSHYGDKTRTLIFHSVHLDFQEHLQPSICNSPEILIATYVQKVPPANSSPHQYWERMLIFIEECQLLNSQLLVIFDIIGSFTLRD